ncbi:hypothetical protein [Nonomuraea sp. JJY05]|uniref:hypothetical protein n=1 Tax=Nonomuraea sp. JJY05 TaxID=3350255 RepID=UPI00373DF304
MLVHHQGDRQPGSAHLGRQGDGPLELGADEGPDGNLPGEDAGDAGGGGARGALGGDRFLHPAGQWFRHGLPVRGVRGGAGILEDIGTSHLNFMGIRHTLFSGLVS